MKALVIGSEGNIGAPLVRYLAQQGHEVMEVDIRPGYRPGFYTADINNPLDLLPAFDWGPDVVFLLSAIVSRVTCEQAASLAIATNLGGINNVVLLSRRYGAKVVFFSTSEVYGPRAGLMAESDTNLRPNNRYGLSKLLGEQLIRYEAQRGLDAVILRPFMIYDEHETRGDHRSAMIRFAMHLKERRPIQVHKNTQRGWLHSSDAVRAIEAAAKLPRFAIINIGHPELWPIAYVANRIAERIGAPKDLIQLVDQPEQMTPVKMPALDLQMDILDVVPKVHINDGIDRVCYAVMNQAVVNV